MHTQETDRQRFRGENRPVTVCLAMVVWAGLPLVPVRGAPDKSGVTPNTISLPSGPGSVEGLGEAFQPTLNTGTGKYAIGLTVPPGTAGHTPGLSLSYDGGGGNGALGFGWSLGLRSIRRQCEKGIPRYVDGPNERDDDGDGEVDEPDELDVFINELKEELVPRTNGDYFSKNEGPFIRYRPHRSGPEGAIEYWEGTVPDGTLLEFGLTPATRITASPVLIAGGEPQAVTYRWLLERVTDSNGNTIVYTYRKFDGEENQHQKYLARIEYGPGAPPWENFHFVRFHYEERLDSFEDGRPGFLLRTGMRLREIEIGTRGPDLAAFGHAPGDLDGDGAPDYWLNRKYVLEYDDHPHWSLLSSVTLVGTDGTSTLPPSRFQYTTCDPAESTPAAAGVIESPGAPTAVMNLEHVDLIDLNGDALPDILQTSEGISHRAFLNLGERKSDGTREIAWKTEVDEVDAEANGRRAWQHTLQSTGSDIVHLSDMDGDGLADLAVKTGEWNGAGDVVYYRNRGDLSWGPQVPMASRTEAPPSPFGSPDVRTADVDFDKRMDIVQSSLVAGFPRYKVWFNLGEGKYSRPRTVRRGDFGGDPAAFEWPLFSAAGAHITDFNGDRVPDILWITRAGVKVSPGLGHGRFGLTYTAAFPNHRLDEAQIAAARLVDVNNDGLSDVVVDATAEVIPPGEIWYWINLGNRALEERRRITGCPRPRSGEFAIRWADLNGNGTTDFVLAESTSSSRLITVDIGGLLGCGPGTNLLVSVDNGIGGKTKIDYAPSTRFAVNDARSGNPWLDPMPLSVHVVSEIRVSNSLGNVSTTRFRYHDGYYDPVEKEFRGFARVEQAEIGDATAPTLVTTHQFDTGRRVEALKGKLLKQSAHQEDGAVFWVEETNWSTRTLLTGTDGREVVFAYAGANRKTIKELGQGTPVVLEQEFEYDDYGNQTVIRDFGIVAGGDRSAFDDERVTVNEYALNRDAWILRTVMREETRDENDAVIFRRETYYDDERFAGDNLGTVIRGNVTLMKEWYDPREPDGYVMSARTKYDSYGNPVLLLDPLADITQGGDLPTNGHCRGLSYDSLFHAYPVRETIHLGDGKEPLVFQAGYDEGLGAVVQSIGFNNHRTTYGYDSFGRIVNIVKPLDTPQYPTVEYEYFLAQSFGSNGVINFVETRRLDRSIQAAEGSKRDHYLISRKFLDGLGRELLNKKEAESDPETGNPRVAVEGAVLLNSRGTTAETLQPFFSEISSDDLDALLAFEDVGSPGWRGLFQNGGELVSLDLASAHATSMRYDATLRTIEIINADGTISRNVYEPLVDKSYDENDTDPKSPHVDTPMAHHRDGLGRLVRADEIVRLDDGGTRTAKLQTWTTRYEYDLNDKLTRITDSQGNVKAMAYDGLGRKFFMNDLDAGHVHYSCDDAGNIIGRVDAKGQRTVYSYDGANRPRTRNFLDRTGDPETDPVDVQFRYDVRAVDVDQGDRTTATTRNPRGQLVSVRDLSGELHTSYDARGRVEWAVKMIPDPVTGLPVAYRTGYTYDSLDRVTELVYPDNDRLTYGYNRRGLLEWARGGEAGQVIIDSRRYQPSGQLEEVVLGNGVVSRYEYDPRLRMTELLTLGAGETAGEELLHYSYVFDGASNIMGIRDLRPQVPSSHRRHNSQRFEYDDLYRLTRYQLTGESLDPAVNRGTIQYRYDRIGNMLYKGSPATDPGHIEHDEDGKSVVNLGVYEYAGGASGRVGREAGDPPGPHAVTGTASGRAYAYDDNGNMTDIDGLGAEWDFLDRLVRLEGKGMEADYTYDHTGQRVLKDVRKSGRRSFVLYVNQHFEVREGEEPTKFVFAGESRVARVKGTLDPTRERIQRLRLVKGWNPITLCVEPSGGEATLESVLELRPAEVIYTTANGQFVRLDRAATVDVGKPLWVYATAPRTLSVKGRYELATGVLEIPAGSQFLGWPKLEALRPESAFEGIDQLWKYEPTARGWLVKYFDAWNPADNMPQELPPGCAVTTESKSPGQLLYDATGGQDVLFYHADHLGSSNVVTDLAGGLIQGTAFYPYGVPRHDRRGTGWFDSSYKYTGKELDRESRLYYLAARFCESAVGKFLSVDPIAKQDPPTSTLENPQRLNWLSYSLNAPLVYSDPSGNSPQPLEDGENWDVYNKPAGGAASALGHLGTGRQQAAGPSPMYRGVLGDWNLAPPDPSRLGMADLPADYVGDWDPLLRPTFEDSLRAPGPELREPPFTKADTVGGAVRGVLQLAVNLSRQVPLVNEVLADPVSESTYRETQMTNLPPMLEKWQRRAQVESKHAEALGPSIDWLLPVPGTGPMEVLKGDPELFLIEQLR